MGEHVWDRFKKYVEYKFIYLDLKFNFKKGRTLTF